MTHEQKLFTEFTPATAADWEERARKDLRDTALESLFLRTYDGITIKPFFTQEDVQQLPLMQQQPGQFPFMRGTRSGQNNWLNIQQIKVEGNGKPAIDKAADALQRGADGICFVLGNDTLFDIAYLADTLDLSKHVVHFRLKDTPAPFIKRLYAQLEQKHITPDTVRGGVYYDPLTSKGCLSEEEKETAVSMVQQTQDSRDFYSLAVYGSNFSSIGASFTQEIAFTLNAAVTYIDKLTEAGVPLEATFRNMQFYMASGTNYFFEIVKLRVLRLLWAAVAEAYGVEKALAGAIRIHSTTSSWFETTLDPYVNMLRVTTEAMAAILAGCDSLSVTPFDNTFRRSDEFSERIARNVSTILKEEAYLDKAIDPAAGSYYLESLTNQLAVHSWDLFKEVEAQGGFEAAYQNGFILGAITNVSRKKFANIATGREILVGTNKYPNPKEKVDFDPEELIQRADFDTTRAAYPTEVMRMATELHLRKRKRRPRAVVAIIGHAEKRQLNATFAEEFFSCAGFETELQQYNAVAEASDSLIHAAAEVVVISASETTYTHELAPRLKQHHVKPIIILAADPQHMKAEMMQQGYDEFIFEDCDTTTLLELVQKRLAQNEQDQQE
ncbi:methylmalonyl-CoA mutase family protein [Pontibacter sp. SGAir0037]|uniref:methylmalonyl-CoA mutase family protein n=1 Tax=Pontibacter sp. SGAir0037 TaxID=2571030 RepID=UPI0010CD58F3|nr:methylmalonyl-CoA mutase family protein [Pontibacter sp. SGAir0037]QCR24789.1 methylmalonyl-CoA mutase [Pontibacter sp. SGAir0037]